MLVSYNLARFRRAAGLTQKELGAALGGWSEASVSIAERGWDGRRIRKFDADEIARIAMVLGIPVIALLLPPEDAGTAVDYFFDVGADRLVILEGMLREVLPAYEGGTPAADAFIERVIELGGDRYIREAEAVLSGAREAAVEIVNRSQQQSEQITSDARARAESLERDAHGAAPPGLGIAGPVPGGARAARRRPAGFRARVPHPSHRIPGCPACGPHGRCRG